MAKNQNPKPVVTFARWGNYTIAFRTLLEQLGLEVIPPEKTNSQAISEGSKMAPEMFCFPMKVTLGNYLPALKKGANTIFMIQNVGGSCRQRYYGAIQEKVLKDNGYKINFLDFRATPKDVYQTVKDVSGASFWRIMKAAIFFLRKLKLIERVEKTAQYYRPRELEKGETDRLLTDIFSKLEEIKNEKEFSIFKQGTLRKLKEIKIEKKAALPRVALIGEIYTVCDSTINFEVEKKLGLEGIEVYREMDITYHLKKLIFPWKDWVIQRKINPYLRSTVGGHGRDAIYEMLHYIKEDFNGIVHLLPMACLTKNTNITVENYLQKPIKEIEIGEKVLTHKGIFKKVTKIFCRDYKGKILKIDCGGRLKLEITPQHPVLLAKSFIKNHKRILRDTGFIPINRAEKGDFIAIPIPKIIKNNNFLRWEKEYARKPKWQDIKKFTYSSDLLRMLGYWLAEGNIYYDKSKSNPEQKYIRGIEFSFAAKEKKYVNDISAIIKKNFRAGISKYYYPQKNPNKITLRVGNRNLADIVYYLCGSYCDKKIIHNDLTSLRPSLQKEVLKGFFRGDGDFTDNYGETTYRGVTTSWNLANQLFWLLVRSRIKPSIYDQNIENRKPSWMIKISNAEGIKRLGDERIKVTNRVNNIRFKELKDYFLVPIRKIESIDFKGKVYNLEVDDDHSYVANFLACHNCMPEVTVRPILEKLHQQSGIPFLSLSLDEQVAEAGINTRLEAFVDVVKNHYHSKKPLKNYKNEQ